MALETKQVLVTVKAYPNPSKKHGETVCVAGIELKTNKWIRLYPMPYRDLDDEKKFKKYSIIEVRAEKARNDRRPESYKVDIDSIKILDSYDTSDKWERRKKVVLPTLSVSFCEILEKAQQNIISLGVFKPKNVIFLQEKATSKDQEKRKACYTQLGFYDKRKDEIEPIPVTFKYSFFCYNAPNCQGHSLSIIDWELGQSYRSWRWKYRDEITLLEKIKERWLEGMCTKKQDTYFFVGNWKRFRDNFMVLGVFYPPKE